MRKVVNPALMLVVQLDSTPATASASSTSGVENSDEEADAQVDPRERLRATGLHNVKP
jgi:hypothetical protein